MERPAPDCAGSTPVAGPTLRARTVDFFTIRIPDAWSVLRGRAANDNHVRCTCNDEPGDPAPDACPQHDGGAW